MKTKTLSVAGSYLAGVLFAIGWWVLADAASYTYTQKDNPLMEFVFLIPAFVGVIGHILINIIPWSMIGSNDMDLDGRGNGRACGCFLFGQILLWASVGGSIAVFFIHYAKDDADPPVTSQRGGIALIVQAVFNILSAIVLRLSRRDDMGMM